MDFIEVSAKTVNDAITKACIELEASSDKLEVQVISEGSSGFLGFGSKPAVIKVRRKEEPEESFEINTEEVKMEKAPYAAKEAGQNRQHKNVKAEEKAESAEAAKEVETVNESQSENAAEKLEEYAQRKPVSEKTEEEIVSIKASAQQFLDSVFHAMELPVDITMNYRKDNGSLDIDFQGEDMGILIGKRGQTLDSLQYLTSLVVNRDQEEYVRVKLDTENYRKRRKETLENLAKNIAYKVRKTHKAVSLEPMNPFERRIIHSSLQNNKWVETFSEGKEPYRHVVISPKK
ncbi:MAG: protein jag [Lachnospiraceae bacterium]|nr:protein jag [Lachnospiraceae bacterium]